MIQTQICIPSELIGQLKPTELAIVVGLLKLAAAGNSSPSHKQLAEASNMSRTAALNNLQRMRDKGVVRWDKGYEEHLGNIPNTYQIKFIHYV